MFDWLGVLGNVVVGARLTNTLSTGERMKMLLLLLLLLFSLGPLAVSSFSRVADSCEFTSNQYW